MMIVIEYDNCQENKKNYEFLKEQMKIGWKL